MESDQTQLANVNEQDATLQLPAWDSAARLSRGIWKSICEVSNEFSTIFRNPHTAVVIAMQPKDKRDLFLKNFKDGITLIKNQFNEIAISHKDRRGDAISNRHY